MSKIFHVEPGTTYAENMIIHSWAENVFVPVAKCICPNYQMYLSKSELSKIFHGKLGTIDVC